VVLDTVVQYFTLAVIPSKFEGEIVAAISILSIYCDPLQVLRVIWYHCSNEYAWNKLE
jgi:hypothetical protein